jgi:hypothetical protein
MKRLHAACNSGGALGCVYPLLQYPTITRYVHVRYRLL